MEAFGYLVENVLNFCKGPYHVKLASFQASAERKKALTVLADAIATKIKGTYSEPGLFACFPYQLIFTETKKGKAIFQYGSFVGGVLGSGDLPEAERIIEEMVRRLRNRCLL